MTCSVKSKELVEQIQNSHRIAVAFYRRILPLFDAIADAFNCEFAYWEPIETQRPCRSGSQPSKYWAWDYVPLFASNHCYFRQAGSKASPEDLAFEFNLYIDENFKEEKRKELKLSNGRQPGAITLEKGRAIVDVYIFKPREAAKRSFDHLWSKCDPAPIGTEKFKDVGHGIDAVAFEVLLEELVTDHHVVIEKISRLLKESVEEKG
ncbi:hypothetical protein GMLC_36130 [Geomonas limicola]|uniref:Uncharacterized protein n=1 Tax=Geomonas limicola TaxID=2740186 RepID=A0A6V8NDY6_9BACT|nr:hypothetical protein [Geomonas limicola]GFO70034.1 hypothetical protein GMLC_36130 [Geomonas limicola]